MIASFYDKNFIGVDNNASLKIDKDSYKLIKRPVEFNELTCTCEAFSQDIQPTFLVVRDNDKGRYVYGGLAGVPTVNKENKTEINATDLRSILSSDIVLDYSQAMDWGDASKVQSVIAIFFKCWDEQVNQGTFNCELWTVGADGKPWTNDDRLLFKSGDRYVSYPTSPDAVQITDYKFEENYTDGVYNAYDEIKKFLRYYDLYMDAQIDIINKKIKFIIGHTAQNQMNIKLWEYGIKNYGKVTTDVNEAQGYYAVDEKDTSTWVAGNKWILLANGNITNTVANRNLYPIKRRVFMNTESLYDAEREALETLLDVKYNEDIELSADKLKPDLSTRFDVYIERGQGLYKSLPCGELQYDANNELVRFKIGYRYTTVNFI